MDRLVGSEIDKANRNAVGKILSAECILVDIRPAIKAIPGYKSNLITHAGPPIDWERMCRPQKLAIINLIVYEGLADTSEKAERLVETGERMVERNDKNGNVSGMCGVTSASMP